MTGGRTEARQAARRRHPTGRAWAPDRTRVIVRLAERARARGAPWPRVAAAVLVLRGVTGDDVAAFARRIGVPVDEIEQLERGVVPAAAVPARLRAVPDLVDWAWVDAGADQGF
jgi:hypothetical protein